MVDESGDQLLVGEQPVMVGKLEALLGFGKSGAQPNRSFFLIHDGPCTGWVLVETHGVAVVAIKRCGQPCGAKLAGWGLRSEVFRRDVEVVEVVLSLIHI